MYLNYLVEIPKVPGVRKHQRHKNATYVYFYYLDPKTGKQASKCIGKLTHNEKLLKPRLEFYNFFKAKDGTHYSVDYDEYLYKHISDVKYAYAWLRENIPEVKDLDLPIDIFDDHDASKYSDEEYGPYDRYFYPIEGVVNQKDIDEFNLAWLHHVHNNPHHWQHWAIPNEDDSDYTVLEMPSRYVVEMICDWFSFSLARNDTDEIFRYYEAHREKILLHPNTRRLVENILRSMKNVLDCMDDVECLEEIVNA